MPPNANSETRSVGVNHVGEQERRHRFPLRQFAQRLAQLGQALAKRLAHRTLGRIIRRQQKHRQHEDDEPDAGERTADAIALMRDRIETEQWHEAEQRASGFGTGRQKAEHQDQAQDAADIAGRPAGAGQPSDLVRRHQGRHHRIVEDGGEFNADRRQPVGEQQRRDHTGIARLSKPHQAGADHQHGAEGGDPWLAATAGIGDRAQYRRHHRDHQAGRRGGKPPQRLPARRVRGDMGGEIGGKHEGGDQREIGLRGPIEENPADDGGARWILLHISDASGPKLSPCPKCPANHEEAFCLRPRKPYSIRSLQQRLPVS